jgi:hypothetical protein
MAATSYASQFTFRRRHPIPVPIKKAPEIKGSIQEDSVPKIITVDNINNIYTKIIIKIININSLILGLLETKIEKLYPKTKIVIAKRVIHSPTGSIFVHLPLDS